ncbi:MAG: DMT family transporter [Hyphomicrobiaceae bacterium]|nr:DMT family transporter [Hyphomicrobiaceae bacterium]
MTNNLRGILAMLASSAGFVGNDAIVKVVTQELPNGQIIFLRGLIATALMGLITSILGGWSSPRVLLRPAMALRLASAVLATLLVVASLRHLPLSTTNAVIQVSPLIVTAGAALLLGARVGWRRWTASLMGFLGVLLIIKPGTAGFAPEAWLAVACLAFAATRDLTTRFIDHSVPSIFVTFATSCIITLAGIGLMPFEVWVMPSQQALTLLMASAVCLFFAYHFGVVAMRTGEIPVVAPFRYASIVLALILGLGIWGHVPDVPALAGMGVVVVAGLYLLYNERHSIRGVAPAGPARTLTGAKADS